MFATTTIGSEVFGGYCLARKVRAVTAIEPMQVTRWFETAKMLSTGKHLGKCSRYHLLMWMSSAHVTKPMAP